MSERSRRAAVAHMLCSWGVDPRDIREWFDVDAETVRRWNRYPVRYWLEGRIKANGSWKERHREQNRARDRYYSWAKRQMARRGQLPRRRRLRRCGCDLPALDRETGICEWCGGYVE